MLHDPRKKLRKNSEPSLAADIALMHLRRAASVGLLRNSAPDDVARVFINTLQQIARDRFHDYLPAEADVALRNCGVSLPFERVIEISEDEDRFAFMSIEERGGLLRLSESDRIKYQLWLLGVYGQTRDERISKRDARRADRDRRQNERRKRERAERRGPLHVNISKAATALGVAHHRARTLYLRWLETSPEIDETESQNPAAHIFIHYARRVFEFESHVKPWTALGISKATYYRRKAREADLRDDEMHRP